MKASQPPSATRRWASRSGAIGLPSRPYAWMTLLWADFWMSLTEGAGRGTWKGRQLWKIYTDVFTGL
jgi:hypothetical protein